MRDVFEFANVPYNFRNQSKCSRSISCKERYRIETVPKLWGKVYTQIKNSKSLEGFKARVKSCIPKNCPGMICKLFIKHVAYL